MKKILVFLILIGVIFIIPISLSILMISFLTDWTEELNKAWRQATFQLITNVENTVPNWSPMTWQFPKNWWGSFDWHMEVEWVSAIDFIEIQNINYDWFKNFDFFDYTLDELTSYWWRKHKQIKVFSTISWKVTFAWYKWTWWWQTCKFLPWKKVEWNSYWNAVFIENEDYIIKVSHLSSINKFLKEWIEVWYWTVLWIYWNTWCSSWPHLHYEVKRKEANEVWWIRYWTTEKNITKSEMLSMIWDVKDIWNYYAANHVWFSFNDWWNSIEIIDVEKAKMNKLFDYYSWKEWIDSNFIKAIAYKETKWQNYAVSYVWAAWLMQFMPSTWREYWLVVPVYEEWACNYWKRWPTKFWLDWVLSLWCDLSDERFDLEKSIESAAKKLSRSVNSEKCWWDYSCAAAYYNWWTWTLGCQEYIWLDSESCINWIIESKCNKWKSSKDSIEQVCQYTDLVNNYMRTFESWKFPK